jgi:sporulation protein YlmC with PRC-barrel domain
MITKHFATAAVATALMLGAVQAQTPQSATKMESSSTNVNQAYKGQWRINKMIGLDVYNRENQRLGDISDILFDQTGRIQTVILGVGGFLGVGERLVAVSFDRLKFVDERIEPKSASGSSSSSPAAGKTAEGNVAPTTGLAATARPARTSEQQWHPDHAVIDVTADQLRAMPQFKFN